MTDRTNHRAEAERLLTDANEWSMIVGELGPEASERACLAAAQVHALLAIHDTLTAADRYAANEERQRGAGYDPLDEDDHRDRLTDLAPTPVDTEHWIAWPEGAAETRKVAEFVERMAKPEPEPATGNVTVVDSGLTVPDPLDEDDHRDRIDCNGQRWGRMDGGCWHHEGKYPHDFGRCSWTLQQLQGAYGLLTFAPEAAQDATGDDLSASEGESGAEERGDTDNAPEPLLCPECGDHINTHDIEGCAHLCDCPRTPEDVARALIAEAVEQAGGGRG